LLLLRRLPPAPGRRAVRVSLATGGRLGGAAHRSSDPATGRWRHLVATVVRLAQVHDLHVVGLTQEPAELAEAQRRLVPTRLELEHPTLHIRVAHRLAGTPHQPLDRAPYH